MNELKALESLGFTLPSPAYLVGAIVFGIIGLLAYRHGKKVADSPTRWLGIALMLYPYAIAETWLLFAVGTALCAAVYFRHRPGR